MLRIAIKMSSITNDIMSVVRKKIKFLYKKKKIRVREVLKE